MANTWCVLGTINSSNQNVGERKEWVRDPAGEVSKGWIVEDYKLTFPGGQWGAVARFQAGEWKHLIYVLESSPWPDILCMFKTTGWRWATERHGYLTDLPSFTLKPTAEARQSLLGPASSKLSFPHSGRSVWWTCHFLEKSALSHSMTRKGRRSRFTLCGEAHWVWGQEMGDGSGKLTDLVGISPQREALWVEVGRREEPPHSALRRGSTPRWDRRVGSTKANVMCNFKTKSLQSVAGQEGQSFPEGISGQPMLHCSQFPAMAAITWPAPWPVPLPGVPEVTEWFLCFHRADLSVPRGKCLLPQGHGPKTELTASSLCSQDAAGGGPRGQDVAGNSAGAYALWVFILFPTFLKLHDNQS